MKKLLMFVLFVFWVVPASEILSEAEVFAQDALWSRTYGGCFSKDRRQAVIFKTRYKLSRNVLAPVLKRAGAFLLKDFPKA